MDGHEVATDRNGTLRCGKCGFSTIHAVEGELHSLRPNTGKKPPVEAAFREVLVQAERSTTGRVLEGVAFLMAAVWISGGFLVLTADSDSLLVALTKLTVPLLIPLALALWGQRIRAAALETVMRIRDDLASDWWDSVGRSVLLEAQRPRETP